MSPTALLTGSETFRKCPELPGRSQDVKRWAFSDLRQNLSARSFSPNGSSSGQLLVFPPIGGSHGIRATGHRRRAPQRGKGREVLQALSRSAALATTITDSRGLQAAVSLLDPTLIRSSPE